jgi:hypothetical protein
MAKGTGGINNIFHISTPISSILVVNFRREIVLGLDLAMGVQGIMFINIFEKNIARERMWITSNRLCSFLPILIIVIVVYKAELRKDIGLI